MSKETYTISSFIPEKKNKNFMFLFFIIITVLICVLYACNSNRYADFYPINGTFQNFNPVRRFLSGQTPYKDFQDYLGLGHLYTGTVMTKIFGGNYMASLKGFSFLQFFSIAMIFFSIGYSILRNKILSAILTDLFLFFILTSPNLFKNTLALSNDFYDSVSSSLSMGASARFVRGMILPVSMLFLYIGYKGISEYISKKNISSKNLEPILFCGIGIIAGFAFIWGNDYGISCWLCLIITAFLLCFSRSHNFVRSLSSTFLTICSSIFSIFLLSELFTLGHFMEWCSSTLGSGGYQSWYFGTKYSSIEISSYIFDVDFSTIMLIQVGVAITYFILLFIHKGNIKAFFRYGILGYANLTAFCAVNEYKILSNGYSREVALSVLYITIIIELLNRIFTKLSDNYYKLIITGTSILCTAWLFSTAKDYFVFTFFTPKEGTKFDKMGGYVKSFKDDLLQTADFLQDDTYWSAYASAQEVLSDWFQPSGTDYIIHVLGDTQREKYMESFTSGDFKYTATPRETFNDWSYWIERVNWYFYRELYKNWHPVYGNTYEMYWKRNENENENTIEDGFSVQIIDIDDSSKKIKIIADSDINGVADVFIDYQIEKKDIRSSAFVIQQMLKVRNEGSRYASHPYFETNYLRPVSGEYIPIYISNGTGETVISSVPERNTSLIINDYYCNTIYTSSYNFLTVEQILNEGRTISVLNTNKNKFVLKNITFIVYDNVYYHVENISEKNNFIHISLENPLIMTTEKGNQIFIPDL